MKQYKIFFIII